MNEVKLEQIEKVTELLQYFTGTVTTTTATRTYAATSIESGLAVGDKIVIAGCAQTNSNGTKTIESVATNSITVVEAIGTGEGPTASVTMNQELQGTWQESQRYTTLTGSINTSGAAIIYIDQSANGVDTDYTTTWAVTAATALAYSAEVVLPFARIRVRTNAADQTIMRAYLFGRKVS